MASLVGSLYVSLTADYSQYQRNMRQAEAITARTTGSIRRNMGVTERSVTGLQRSMSNGLRPGALIAAGRSFDSVASRANLLRGSVFALTAAFGGLGAALTTNVISRYLDTFTNLENQMRVVSNGSADLAANINAVGDVAARSRSSLQAVGTLFSRLQKAQPGESISNTLRRVETINKALQLGGATAQEAASAAIQFSQAIASNRLGGEELRAVLETPLGLELAKGLGVTIGKLREMGYAGELTAKVVTGALDRIASSVDGQFAKSVVTIDQALTVADGAITKFAGHLDDTYGITKVLSGGILGFANNLQTIVPLLASVGIGLGSVFAGRLAGRGAGGLAGGVNAIRARNAQLKENVRLEGEAAKAARATADAAAVEARAVSQKSASDFASPAAAKAYQRDLGAIQKLDKERINLLESQRQLTYQLGTVTSKTTAGAVRAADALATAQGKVNEQLSKRWSIQAQLTKTDKALANMPKAGVAPNWLFPADVDAKEKDLLARRTKLASQLAQIDGRLAKDRETLVQRQMRLTELGTESERRAATERANILVREQQARAAIERNQARRGVFGASLRASGAAVQATGGLGLAGAQLDAASTLIRTEQAAAKASRSLAAAAAAARFTSQSFNVMKTVGGSLIGFLGGPWGAAFTAAIAVATILGIRTQKSAEQIARARAVISEELGNLEASGAPTTTEQRLSILGDKITAEANRVKDVTAQLEGVRSEITNGLAQGLARATTLSTRQFYSQYTALAEQFKAGSLSVDEFIKGLENLGLSAQAIEKVTAGMTDVIAEGRTAEQVIALVRQRIADLDGQVARVKIEVDYGNFVGGFGAQDPLKDQITQRAQYGAGQNAARDQVQLAKLRNEILAAAGEQDSILNSPQKINARTDALLELGGSYGLTRAEAEKLAAEELNLAERTRLGAASAKSAANDYENFANKLEELQQRAAASGLSDLDRDVVQFAEKLKNGSTMMKQYIDAISSGDLSKAPAELLKVRDALIEIEASSAATGILQQYGTAAQLAGVFAEKQAILNSAVMSGKITAEQASIAYGEYLATFGEYEWVNDLSSAVTGFAQSAITDFDNVGDALKNLAQEVLNLVIQLTILKPLQNGIMSLLGGGASSVFPNAPGGGAATGIVGSILDIFHAGTGNAQPGAGAQRFVPSSAMRGARRYHSGLKSFEMGAVLKKGEAVLNEQQQGHAAGIIGGLAGAVRGGGGSGGVAHVEVSVNDKGELQAYVMRTSQAVTSEGIKRYDKTSPARFPRDARQAKTRGSI